MAKDVAHILDEDQMMALARVVKDCAEHHGEDIIGALIKNGAALFIEEKTLIRLAATLGELYERSEKEIPKRVEAKL